MTKESDFQKKIIKLINSKYGICLKYNENATTRCGVPDLFAAINNKAVFIEAKTDVGRASEIQVQQMKRIKERATKYVYKIAPKDYNYLVEELDKIKRGD